MPVKSVQAPCSPSESGSAAALVALADRCVQCGLCLPHCPTYRLDRQEAESPRGRIAYVRAVATGALDPTPAGDLHLDHCLGCRRCEPVCPAGVSYGELLVQARTTQASRRPRPAAERRILALLRRPGLLDRLLGLYRLVGPLLPRRWRLLPLPPATSAASALTDSPAGPAMAAVFVGCIARRYEGPARVALLKLLEATGVTAAIPPAQGCCGAAAAHSGDASAAAGLGAANRTAFGSHQTVLCLASGCHDTLANSLGGTATVEDPLALLDRLGDRLQFRAANRRVALHLPCTQRSVVGSGPALRRLLLRIPGIDLVDLPDTGCCGAAGLHQIAEPGRAAIFRRPLLDALESSRAAELLSANLGCRLHLAGGTTLSVRHPLEFLAEHLA